MYCSYTMYQELFFHKGFFFASMPGRSLFFIWILEWSGKMEHAMERTLEWDSHGQMEPSSANYGPVQLNPMVTQMKDQALCISLCFLSIHSLFIWKCTLFALVSRNAIPEREIASLWRLCVEKPELLGQKTLPAAEKVAIICSHRLLTCFLGKTRSRSSWKSLGTLAHASEHVPLARWSKVLLDGYT